MDLKFVARQRDLNAVFPFPNQYRRTNGTAKVEYPLLGTGERVMAYLSQYSQKTQKQELMNPIDKAMSEIKEGELMKFIELEDPETGVREVTVWNPLEWQVFIVNDNGKTVDSL